MAAMTMMACSCTDNVTDEHATSQTPSHADLLVGRWNMVLMNGAPLTNGLYCIDEYRSDGMYISTVGSTLYGTILTDSTRYTVVGDSIVYEDEGWGAEEVVFLDSLNLAKSGDVPPYGIIRSDFERM